MKMTTFASLALAGALPLIALAQMPADNGKSASGTSSAATPSPTPNDATPIVSVPTYNPGITHPKSGANAAGSTDGTGTTK